MQVIVDHFQDEAANIRTFFFRPERPMQYTAGQYIELTLPHDNEDDRGHKRWFTLSSSPSDDLLSITTKCAGDEHSSSFKKALFGLDPGAKLHMSDPMGDFVLPKLVQTPLVFVAGGIGITPFHSMLSWLAATGEQRPIQMIYGVRVEDEIIFQPTLEAAKQHATIIVSQPTDSWGGERGQLSAELILGLAETTDETLIYLSGPEPMTEALSKALQRAGVKRHQLVTDDFPGYSQI